MAFPKIGILHYSSPPTVGGVEMVIHEHTKQFVAHGYPISVISGRGSISALPAGVNYVHLARIDSQDPFVKSISADLNLGIVPETFSQATHQIYEELIPVVTEIDTLIVHNVFTKHFNLPLTAALTRLVEESHIGNCIAWCHDFTWTSPNSRTKVHEGYPWELLKHQQTQITYVVVSKERQQTLAALFQCPDEVIHVVYNGVNPIEILGLSPESIQLSQRLQLFNADLLLLMPVRITQAKNIEYAMQVIHELKKYVADPRMIITGPPDPHDPNNMAYYDDLLALRTSYNLERNVHFIYSSRMDLGESYLISSTVVGDLYRISDLMFMPSHREGFGMPILEAGLAGLHVMSTAVPASIEIGLEGVEIFNADAPAETTAELIIDWAEENHEFQFKQKIRQRFTWEIIFKKDIVPLLSP